MLICRSARRDVSVHEEADDREGDGLEVDAVVTHLQSSRPSNVRNAMPFNYILKININIYLGVSCFQSMLYAILDYASCMENFHVDK